MTKNLRQMKVMLMAWSQEALEQLEHMQVRLHFVEQVESGQRVWKGLTERQIKTFTIDLSVNNVPYKVTGSTLELT